MTAAEERRFGPLTTYRLRDYGRMVRDGWILILIATLLSVGAAWGGTYLQKEKYQSSATVFVSIPGAASSLNSLSNNRGSLVRVQSYIDLAASTQVLGRAAATLQSNEDPASLKKKVLLTSLGGSAIITITAEESTAEGAQALANAVSVALVQVTTELESTPAGVNAMLQVIDKAPLPTSRVSPVLKSNLELGAIVGLLVGMVLTISRGLRDGSVHYRDEVKLLLKKEGART